MCSLRDIVRINVGGEVVQTRRETLCFVEDSMLASMFSGRWDKLLQRDDSGNIFLDYNPLCFKIILNQIRTLQIQGVQEFKIPTEVCSEEEENLFALIRYLGLVHIVEEDLIFQTNKGAAISQRGKQVSCRSSFEAHAFAQSTLIPTGLKASSKYWALKVSLPNPKSWLFLGIIHQNTNGIASFYSPSSFGFTSMSNNTVHNAYKAGRPLIIEDWPGWENGDHVIFKLDTENHSLSLRNLKNGRTFLITDPQIAGNLQWRIHINFRNEGSKVEIVPHYSSDRF